MLYYLLQYLDNLYDVPGFGVFKYLSFRAILALIFSLIISLLIGGKIIDLLRKNLIGESIRKDGPETHHKKAGTPTMGGLIIIAAIVIPVMLWGDIKNAYIWLALVGIIWMGLIGFLDDYIKVFKKDKEGLKGRFKILGQVGLGLMVGLTMVFHPDFMGTRANITQLFVIKTTNMLENTGFMNGDKLLKVNGFTFEKLPENGSRYPEMASYTVERIVKQENSVEAVQQITINVPEDAQRRKAIAKEIFGSYDKNFVYQTNLPFWKDYVFDYSRVWVLKNYISEDVLGRFVYILVVIFIVTAVSNGVNITDGIDGLAAGTSAIVGTTLGLFAYLSGNSIYSNYLHISYIPLAPELIVYAAALVGACIGFLWYNTYPAEVFMGDTGSLSLGGAIAVMALMVKKELLLPILCGIFFVESLSVIVQVSYFKYTKRKYGEGRRIFRMSPLHHHFEKGGLAEAKIVTRFWIVAILLSVLAFATLKLR